ncbi:unnamed protein product [Eruca vesicaria subsp. sativa]|uniref:F-box domain-containing protein n=1 Tax=Eruca vesicaria subsp. sativa TaxID=29727 RepID=A0ABC8M7T0_ERUVS|nr:unnamed protein product [Eruca vesicaria subsp. sativa]
MVFRRRDDFVAPLEIPFDLVIDILRRLPAKSLMRFRCVSKLWSGLIRSRNFSNLYFRKKVSSSSTSGQPLLLYLNHNNFVAHSNQVDPIKSQQLSLTLLPSSDCFESSTLRPDLPSPTMEDMGVDGMVILRGLILYTFCRKACIYNPATRQSLTLPANICAQQERPHKHVYYFFGHDPVLDQYKIVCNVFESWKTSKFWVFVLEPGGFWKRIEDDAEPHTPWERGLCINGVIYYLASDHKRINAIYCFDVRSEKLRVIQTPHEVSAMGRRVRFIEHGGKPTLFDYTLIKETGVSELWVLEDGLVGTWSRKSLVLKPCQRHLLDDIIVGWTRLHGTGQNNEVILEFPHRCYLFGYDLIKNDLRKINIIRERTYMEIKVMDKCESIMHLET